MNQIKRFWAIDDHGADAKAGWFAWYTMPHPPYVLSYPLIGWALVNRDGEDHIVGVVAVGTQVIEADRPTDKDMFAMYMQRGQYEQDQLDALITALYESGQRLEKHEQEARRNAPEVGEGRVLQTARKDGATEVSKRAIRALQGEIEGRGPGDSSDAPLQSPDDVEE